MVYQEMEKEKIIGTFTVAGLNKIDLFRIHLFEKSIRFDEHFAKGIAKNKALSQRIMEISNQWGNKKIKIEKDAFFKILKELKNHEEYLSKYYFTEKELDTRGRFIEPLPIDTLIEGEHKKEIREHFEYLKYSQKLKSITKKEFEKNIRREDVADFYVDNYPKGNIKYYCYTTFTGDETAKCYLLVKNNTILLGFATN